MTLPHSKLPLVLGHLVEPLSGSGGSFYEITSDLFIVAEAQNLEDARYLVLAANRLPEALKLLKRCKKWIKDYEGMSVEADRMVRDMLAFLADIEKEMKK